jgi:asparagine synthetase B (glutamine-hydrolysing)
MCGIIAVFDSQPGRSYKPDELLSQIQDSLGYIAHRGPDASAVWVNEDATCGRSLYRGKKKLNGRAGTLPTCNQRSHGRW